MTEDQKRHEDSVLVGRTVEVAVKVGAIGLLLVLSFLIIRTFIVPILWGVIIAIGIFPVHQKLTAAIGNRKKIAAGILTIASLAILMTITIVFMDSTVSGIRTLRADIENGTITIPPPSDSVQDWPIIGEPVDEFWRLASENIQEAAQELSPYIKTYGRKFLSVLMGLGLMIIQFTISIIIAGVLLAKASAGGRVVVTFFNRVAGQQGESLAILAVATIRSVVQGVIGIAVIQSILAGVGLFAVGVPAAGLWALLVLFFAIIQLPPLLVLGPIIIFVFSTSEFTPALIFMLWSILVSLGDNFVKPFLLGRGIEVPMLVVLMGAIGGMMMSGFIGLFIGPVVLCISFKLISAWIENRPSQLQKSDDRLPDTNADLAGR